MVVEDYIINIIGLATSNVSFCYDNPLRSREEVMYNMILSLQSKESKAQYILYDMMIKFPVFYFISYSEIHG